MQGKVERMLVRRKKKFLEDKPALEWRLPVMILTVSGMVFILLTAMFGVTVDTRTGDVRFDLQPGSDWSNPLVDKPMEDEGHGNPMDQYPWFCWLAMILGYFICAGMFCYFWFEYMKWRWMHVPEEIRFTTKKVRYGKILYPMNGRSKEEVYVRRSDTSNRER